MTSISLNNPHRIIVGISGGVDSAVTAHLLQEQGHQVEGLFMFNWSEDEDAYCTAAEDFEVASQVCRDLGIVLHRADFSAAYRERVFAHFLNEYKAGRTPSPDLLCNREIKFKEFTDFAAQLGADAVATGHYARIEHGADRSRLLLAEDQNKDQTYFLAAVHPQALRRVHFPLGNYPKAQVREIANQAGLPNYQRKDSTGICFIGERPMREFLNRYISCSPGTILDDQGHKVGEHQGLSFYTIGQRKGLGIGGQAHASEAPWFVTGKDAENNQLLVSQNPEHPHLSCQYAEVEAPHWLHPPEGIFRGSARIRHRQSLQACQLEQDRMGRWVLAFDEKQWAIAPGQSAVFYQDNECLGCAVIKQALPTL